MVPWRHRVTTVHKWTFLDELTPARTTGDVCNTYAVLSALHEANLCVVIKYSPGGILTGEQVQVNITVCGNSRYESYYSERQMLCAWVSKL